MFGDSWRYKFEESDYSLYLFWNYGSPMTYLYEQGTYVLKKHELTFTPKLRLACNLIDTVRLFDCASIGTPELGFFISTDTLTVEEIIELKLEVRTCRVFYDADKLLFTDPQKPHCTFRSMERKQR
jgi:hypothetical protein